MRCFQAPFQQTNQHFTTAYFTYFQTLTFIWIAQSSLLMSISTEPSCLCSFFRGKCSLFWLKSIELYIYHNLMFAPIQKGLHILDAKAFSQRRVYLYTVCSTKSCDCERGHEVHVQAKHKDILFLSFFLAKAKKQQHFLHCNNKHDCNWVMSDLSSSLRDPLSYLGIGKGVKFNALSLKDMHSFGDIVISDRSYLNS